MAVSFLPGNIPLIEEMADSNASAGFEIFVEKEGSSILEFLTRKVIGLN